MLDCCHEELGAQVDAQQGDGGATVVKPPSKSLVLFAAQPGKLAKDGPEGGHGVLTEAVLPLIGRCVVGGRSLQQISSTVKAAVMEITDGTQEPNFTENDCAADIFLAGDSYELGDELSANEFSKYSGGFEGSFADTNAFFGGLCDAVQLPMAPCLIHFVQSVLFGQVGCRS